LGLTNYFEVQSNSLPAELPPIPPSEMSSSNKITQTAHSTLSQHSVGLQSTSPLQERKKAYQQAYRDSHKEQKKNRGKTHYKSHKEETTPLAPKSSYNTLLSKSPLSQENNNRPRVADEPTMDALSNEDFNTLYNYCFPPTEHSYQDPVNISSPIQPSLTPTLEFQIGLTLPIDKTT
jgi:hypothetical protein